MLLAGIGLLIVGLGFKAAVAPFHVWTPDVYEGSPTAVTAYMSVAAKAAAFAAILRVFLTAFPSLAADWSGMLAVIAILTIIIGNTVAIAQQNIKRLLAYSSIAHAGYILVAVVAANELGVQSVLYYTLAYTLMNLGAFAVVILLGRRGEENVMIADYAGVGYRQPLLGAAMTIFMLSLAGIPPTAGFFGKFYIFSAALQAGQYVLAVVGILGSVISVYYYLRVIYTMYMVEPARDLGKPDRAPWATAAAAIAVAGVLLLGLFPQLVIGLAQGSAHLLPVGPRAPSRGGHPVYTFGGKPGTASLQSFGEGTPWQRPSLPRPPWLRRRRRLPPSRSAGRDVLSLADFSGPEILTILQRAQQLKELQRRREPHRWLEGCTLAMIFEKPSLRTRCTFETGMTQLGGHAIDLGAEHMQMGTRESVPDVARNLERWVDAIMARVFLHSTVTTLAEYARIPVINGLSDYSHPCQVLADSADRAGAQGHPAGAEDLLRRGRLQRHQLAAVRRGGVGAGAARGHARRTTSPGRTW